MLILLSELSEKIEWIVMANMPNRKFSMNGSTLRFSVLYVQNNILHPSTLLLRVGDYSVFQGITPASKKNRLIREGE